MKLSPKERRKIYEEEKARIAAKQKRQTAQGSSTTRLEPNVAGLLCYLAGWITGIIFLVLEQKNKFIRFHAMQSIVTFGFLTIAGILLSALPFVGDFLALAIGIVVLILWIILMVKAYQGELYKLPVAGNIAEGILPAFRRGGKYETAKEQEAAESTGVSQAAKSEQAEGVGERVDDYSTGTRAGRIAGYSFAIFWNLVLLIFFSFFHRYIAWYHVQPDGSVMGLPLLTNDYFAWLPILITALLLSIAAYIILIIYDKYWLRETIQIILNIIGVAVIVNLLFIFPFNFNVIPNNTAVYVVPIVVTIVLILIAVGLGVAALVHFIKLIVNSARQSSS
ncbi:MAG: DUF4870 domain-containing protein [Chloroflexi bacterium]|nr:DUF4870 domain-containing protein [Chloroflexota bacterium]